MAKRREWNLQQQSRQIQQQIRHGESPQAAVSDTLGEGGADVHAGGGTAAGVAAVAGAEGAVSGAEGAVSGDGGASVGGAGEAEDIDNQNLTQMRAGGATAIGAAGGDTIQGGPRASGSAMAARLVHRARGFATEVSDMLFRGVKRR